MREPAFQIGMAVYGLWIGGILVALYLMLTNRPAARPAVTIVLFGSIGLGLVLVGAVIARSAGVL